MDEWKGPLSSDNNHKIMDGYAYIIIGLFAKNETYVGCPQKIELSGGQDAWYLEHSSRPAACARMQRIRGAVATAHAPLYIPLSARWQPRAHPACMHE